jgi:transcriptional regulator with XRE-family HTH domain
LNLNKNVGNSQVTIGERLRKIRRTQGRTLKEIAGNAAITVSLLSKIENNKSQPPIATLTRIAGSLGVSISSLLSDAHESGTIFIPAKNTSQTTRADKGYEFFSFATQRTAKLMDVFLFSAKKGEVSPQPMCHSGEEFVYVLSGKMQYSVGSAQYTLRAGDALYFDSEADHDLQPLTKEVKYLAVFCTRPRNN